MSADDIRREDPFITCDEVTSTSVPEGWDRRAFMMRSAMIGAVAVLSGCAPPSTKEAADQAASAPPAPSKGNVSADLDVVRQEGCRRARA